MNLICPANAKVLGYLSRPRPDTPVLAPHDSIANPYYRCGCHPEIVERLWDQLGAALPADARALVHGIPALVHPVSGVILAIGLGTQYGLRLPAALGATARAAGAKTTTTWSGGSVLDIQHSLGSDWVFGAWLGGELDWCRLAFAAFDRDLP